MKKQNNGITNRKRGVRCISLLISLLLILVLWGCGYQEEFEIPDSVIPETSPDWEPVPTEEPDEKRKIQAIIIQIMMTCQK